MRQLLNFRRYAYGVEKKSPYEYWVPYRYGDARTHMVILRAKQNLYGYRELKVIRIQLLYNEFYTRKGGKKTLQHRNYDHCQ